MASAWHGEVVKDDNGDEPGDLSEDGVVKKGSLARQ